MKFRIFSESSEILGLYDAKVNRGICRNEDGVRKVFSHGDFVEADFIGFARCLTQIRLCSKSGAEMRMIMRKRVLVLGMVLALSAMTFVGCGSNDMNNSATDQESASPAADDNGVDDQPQATDDGSITDDLEEGADDVIDGAGDALEDAGDAAGDAIDDLDGDTTDDTTNDNNDNTNTNKNNTGDRQR